MTQHPEKQTQTFCVGVITRCGEVHAKRERERNRISKTKIYTLGENEEEKKII